MISKSKLPTTPAAVLEMILGVAVGAILSVPARAQESPPRSAPAQETGDLEEVFVTATRQSLSVNKVPISMTAVTSENLEKQGVKDVQDLTRMVPGMTFRRDANDGNPDISIRGVKSFSQGTPTTGVYLDDVPIQKRGSSGGITGNGSPFPQLYDMERIEVLRGPQGTLYGSSAEGGAVRFISRTPSLTQYDVTARGETSKVEDGGTSYEGDIAVGAPIIENKLGVRASASYHRQGGYIDHVSLYTGETFAPNANWREAKSFRLAMLWQPTDQLKITPSAYYSGDYQHDGELAFGNVPQFTINSGVFTNKGVTPGGVQYDFPDKLFTGGTFGPYNYLGPGKTPMGNYSDYNSTPEFAGSPRNSTLFVPSVTVDYDFGPVTLKSITARIDDTVQGYTPGVTQMFGTFPAVMPNSTNAQLVIPGSVAATCASASSRTDDGICRVPVTGGTGSNFLVPGFPDRFAQSVYFNARRAFSQEFRIQSAPDSGRLSWIAGLYYNESRYRQNLENYGNDQDVSMFLRGVGFEWFLGAPASSTTGQLLPVGAPGLSTWRHQITVEKEKAIFGEMSYEFTPKLKGTVGVRAFESSLDYRQLSAGGNLVGNPPGFVATPQPPAAITDPTQGHPFANQPGDPVNTTAGAQKEHPVTPKVGLSYQLDDSNLFYGTVASGYRAGGINIPASQGNCGPVLQALGWTTTPEEYKSDKLVNYELGAKNRFGNWQVNSSVFFIQWKDPQINQRLSQCLFNYLSNGGAAISRGFDVQLNGRVGAVTLNASASYTDAHYTETVLTQVSAGGAAQVVVRDGDALGVPKWQARASAQYDFNVAGVQSYIRADYSYDGDYYRTTGPGTISYDPVGYQGEAFRNVGLRIGMNFPRVEASLFADNLTNEDTVLSIARPSGSFITYLSNQRPREVGVTVSTRF
ncbi:MAG: TonB-dependent receptor [Gammaproteobacteria bacterium]